LKSETRFRIRVTKFLQSLENCVSESIQQVAIRGSFDMILCIQGRFVGAELKDELGRADALQAFKATRIRSQGKGIAIIWRPQNHEDVKNFLTQLNAGIFDKPLLAKINKEESAL
jgi:hypothetical protein